MLHLYILLHILHFPLSQPSLWELLAPAAHWEAEVQSAYINSPRSLGAERVGNGAAGTLLRSSSCYIMPSPESNAIDFF